VASTLIPPLAAADLPANAPSTPSGRRGALATTLDDVFSTGVRLRASRDAAADATALRRQVLHGLRTAEQQSLALGYPRSSVRAALFAAIVFLDEVVLNTRPMFSDWARRPLQEEVFGEHVGGEVFFTQLDEQLARPDSEDAGDALEVFQLCLLLGFRGRHGSNEGELAGIATRIARKLERIRGPQMAIAPHWALPTGEAVPERVDPLAGKLQRAAIIAGVATLALYAIFALLLSNAGSAWNDLALQLGRR
jgi:type VI secretion system protein ImpK